jgi:hypothetical protein
MPRNKELSGRAVEMAHAHHEGNFIMALKLEVCEIEAQFSDDFHGLLIPHQGIRPTGFPGAGVKRNQQRFRNTFQNGQGFPSTFGSSRQSNPHPKDP